MRVSPNNDQGCGWVNILTRREANPSINQNIKAKYVIIGAGYSGLSAAITLAENCPNDEIILIEANRAGEGASARNSGYLVDSTLNDGHLSDTGLKSYKDKLALNEQGVLAVKNLIDKYNIDCDWEEDGRTYCSSTLDSREKLEKFIELLDNLGHKSQFFNPSELSNYLGTDFYKIGVKVFSGAMLQPAALARGMINALPQNVTLYENSVVNNVQHKNGKHFLNVSGFEVEAENLIYAVNGFMASLKVKRDRAFPLLLTASLTRPLNDEERAAINDQGSWAVLSANHMGATLRYTKDHRLMIRNTVEVSSTLQLSKSEMDLRVDTHLRGLKARFPFLGDDIIQHSWAGMTCISGNNANIFEEIEKNCWAIGCYNGGGIGLGTLFGQQAALKILDQNTKVHHMIDQRPKPNWLPPQPFLNWGVKIKLAKDRMNAVEEV